MLAPRALNTTKNPINFCSTYLSPVPKAGFIISGDKHLLNIKEYHFFEKVAGK